MRKMPLLFPQTLLFCGGFLTPDGVKTICLVFTSFRQCNPFACIGTIRIYPQYALNSVTFTAYVQCTSGKPAIMMINLSLRESSMKLVGPSIEVTIADVNYKFPSIYIHLHGPVNIDSIPLDYSAQSCCGMACVMRVHACHSCTQCQVAYRMSLLRLSCGHTARVSKWIPITDFTGNVLPHRESVMHPRIAAAWNMYVWIM